MRAQPKIVEDRLAPRVARYVGVVGLLTATAIAVSRTTRTTERAIATPWAGSQAARAARVPSTHRHRLALVGLASISPWGWGALVLLVMLILSSLGGAARALLVTMTPLCALLAVGGILWASYRDRIPNRAVVRIVALVGVLAGSALYVGHSMDQVL
jgi:hypothetical protein